MWIGIHISHKMPEDFTEQCFKVIFKISFGSSIQRGLKEAIQNHCIKTSTVQSFQCIPKQLQCYDNMDHPYQQLIGD